MKFSEDEFAGAPAPLEASAKNRYGLRALCALCDEKSTEQYEFLTPRRAFSLFFQIIPNKSTLFAFFCNKASF